MDYFQIERLKKITSEIIQEEQRITQIKNCLHQEGVLTNGAYTNTLGSTIRLFKNPKKIEKMIIDLLQKEVDEHNENLKNLSALDIAMKLEKGDN